MLKKTLIACSIFTAVATGMVSTPVAKAAPIQITEFCSNSGVGNNEFVEFTNTGPVPVDMTSWSEDDSNRTANKAGHILSAFGTVQPGQSVIFTEATPDNFRIFWWGSVAAAPAGLQIIGPYSNDNLSSSSDEINLYDNTSTLVDRLTYPGSPAGGTGNAIGRNAPAGYVVNSNNNSAFIDSAIGDVYGSFRAAGNNALIGNPGTFAVPEPAGLGLLALGITGAVSRRRRS